MIIGDGLAGCAVADELTTREDIAVTVLDKGPPSRPPGPSPGFAVRISPSRALTELARQTVDKYAALTYEGRACFSEVGSLEVATSADRMDGLLRKHDLATAQNIESYLCDADRCAELHPLLDLAATKVAGGLHVPGDGVIDEVRAAAAQRQRAIERGARFLWEHEVLGIIAPRGAVAGVLTDHGPIEADLVVCAAGDGTPTLCRNAGIRVPVASVATSVLEGVLADSGFRGAPVLWHDESAMAFGLSDSGRVVITSPSADSWAQATDLLPALQHTQARNGAIVASVRAGGDFPLLGEAAEVAGFWFITAVWAVHSAGAARALVEWMLDGSPRISLQDCSLGRFHPVQYSAEYARTRSSGTFVRPFGVITRVAGGADGVPLKAGPFDVRHRELGAMSLEMGGWIRPHWYEANRALADAPEARHAARLSGEDSSPAIAEALAARDRVGLFDLTPMQRLSVSGPGALDYLQRLTSNQLDKAAGTITYTLLLNEDGGIRGDMTVARLGPDEFLLGPSWNLPAAWFRRMLPGDGSVTLADLTDSTCCIGLWGPSARSVISAVTGDDFSLPAMGFFKARRATVAGVPVTALQLSQIGELGWELSTTVDRGLELWDAVWSAGQPHGLIAIGRAAAWSLRLEKGYRSWGVEMTSEYHPDEAGVSFLVRPEKGAFLGRDGYLARKDAGTRSLHCLVTQDPSDVVSAAEPVHDRDGKLLGSIASAAFGAATGKRIAYAWLDGPRRPAGTAVAIQHLGRPVPAEVHDDPLFDPTGTRLRA